MGDKNSRWCPVTSLAPQARGLTSSVSYMVLLEEKGEGSGSRSSQGLSADSSSSSPFSGATSHCALLSWGCSVTTTLPGHRPVTGPQGPSSPGSHLSSQPQ